MPNICLRCHGTKATFSHTVPCKGAMHPYPIKQVVHDLDLLGYKKVILKCDQEASILALRREVKAAANLDV
eukprot:5617600-Pyramimonas_sp.AAC.1